MDATGHNHFAGYNVSLSISSVPETWQSGSFLIAVDMLMTLYILLEQKGYKIDAACTETHRALCLLLV